MPQISLSLAWRGVPPRTSPGPLVVHDPDALHSCGFTHWVVFNLLADIKGLQGSVSRREKLGYGAIQKRNDAGTSGYMCPSLPPGKTPSLLLYALSTDRNLQMPADAGRRQALNAAKGHILAETELVCLYQR